MKNKNAVLIGIHDGDLRRYDKSYDTLPLPRTDVRGFLSGTVMNYSTNDCVLCGLNNPACGQDNQIGLHDCCLLASGSGLLPAVFGGSSWCLLASGLIQNHHMCLLASGSELLPAVWRVVTSCLLASGFEQE